MGYSFPLFPLPSAHRDTSTCTFTYLHNVMVKKRERIPICSDI